MQVQGGRKQNAFLGFSQSGQVCESTEIVKHLHNIPQSKDCQFSFWFVFQNVTFLCKFIYLFGYLSRWLYYLFIFLPFCPFLTDENHRIVCEHPAISPRALFGLDAGVGNCRYCKVLGCGLFRPVFQFCRAYLSTVNGHSPKIAPHVTQKERDTSNPRIWTSRSFSL